MPIHYFSDDKAMFHSREVYPAEFVYAAQQLTPAEAPSVEGVLGFGSAITGASCYNLSKMEKEERRALLKQLYSPEGANLSVARISIGSSDYSAELYSYDDVPFDTELTYFSVARDEAYIIPIIQEILEIRPDLFILASPWTPPGWMKTGGLLCGGHMRDQFAECYARYTVKFIQAYAAHGIKISAITPQNEPEKEQMGRMAACVWNPETEAKYVRHLRQLLNDLDLDVKIWIWDESFYGASRVLWALDNLEGLAENCDGVAFHYYHGNVEDTGIIRKKHPKLTLNFTEGGPRLYDNYDTDWCKWSIMISKSLGSGHSFFTGWNLMLDEMGGPNIGPFFCGGLVTRHSITGELDYSGQYKAFRHIAPYVSRNAKIYPLTSSLAGRNEMATFPKGMEPVEGFMIDNGDEKPVFVLINYNTEKAQAQFMAQGQRWYVELMPMTVSTVVF